MSIYGQRCLCSGYICINLHKYYCRVSSICIRFSSSVEGVTGEPLNASELHLFRKVEAVNRHQVVGVQVIVGAKCGYRKKPSQKSIVYKTEYTRNGVGHTFKHTKEYDVQYLGKASVHDMISAINPSLPVYAAQAQNAPETQQDFGVPGGGDASNLKTSHGMKSGLNRGSLGAILEGAQDSDVPVAPSAPVKRAKREVVLSQSLNRPILSEIAVRCVKYVEKSRGVRLQSLCGHFVEDSSNRVWMVGVSKVTPFEEEEAKDDVPKLEMDPAASRMTKSLVRLQDAAEAVLDALKMPSWQRKEKNHQIIFGELRGNHFLDQLSTGWQYEIAKTAEYKFVECGLEVYYSGDVIDEFYVIVQGSGTEASSLHHLVDHNCFLALL